MRTENRLSPDSSWFTDQTAVVAIQQATWGKHRATPWSLSFLNKMTIVQTPKRKPGRGGDPNPCSTCFPPQSILLNQNESISHCTTLHYDTVALIMVSTIPVA